MRRQLLEQNLLQQNLLRRRFLRRQFLQWVLAGAGLVALAPAGCQATGPNPGITTPETPAGTATTQANGPRVVATSTILADLVATLAPGKVQLTSLLKPGDDPHVYEPVPADSRAFEQADLIVYNGHNLEPGLIRLMRATGGRAPQLAVGEVVPALQKPNQTVPDPHVWGDVENVIKMVARLEQALVKLLPTQQAELAASTRQFTATLTRLHQWIRQQVATIPVGQRKLVTTHDAFQYYGRAYGLEIIGTLIGISTEEQPSAQTTRNLIEVVKAAKVPAIFAETTINPTLIRTVAQEAGVKLASPSLYSDSIGSPGSEGDSYVKMMVANTRTITKALGGRVTPWSG